MDLFDHRYYRLGKILMSLIGQWPYQSDREKRAILAILIVSTTYQIVSQILAIVKYRNNGNILVECLVPNIFDTVCAMKYVCFTWHQEKTLKLLNGIRKNWQIWARDREVSFLHEYADRGEKITILYIVTMYTGILVLMTQPMITKIIDVVLKNSTEPGKFSLPAAYYHLDVQKYYFHLNVYCTVCALMILTVLLSSDVMLILYVQHICGIFAAVGHKLERIGTNSASVKTEKCTYALGEASMMYLASCIDSHNDAIEYANVIKASYAWNLFVTLVLGMILINASGLQMMIRRTDLGTTIAFITPILAMIFYFYIESYISQILIDHSISVRSHIHNSEWYRLSTESQKLIQFMTMRCNKPCELRAGNMLTMSVQTFGLALRTFISYFAFARSMQGL